MIARSYEPTLRTVSRPRSVPAEATNTARRGRTPAVAVESGEGLPCHIHHDPNLWFAEAPAELEFAKLLCGGCPIRHACLVGALNRREPWGVWGGEIFERGTVIARKRPRGRPNNAARALDSAHPQLDHGAVKVSRRRNNQRQLGRHVHEELDLAEDHVGARRHGQDRPPVCRGANR